MFKVSFLFRDAISFMHDQLSVDEAAASTKTHIYWLTITQILLIIGSLGTCLYLIGFVYDIEHHQDLTEEEKVARYSNYMYFQGYVYSFAYLVLAAQLTAAFIYLMYILNQVHKSVISEKRKLIAVFFVFTSQYVILCGFFFWFGTYFKVVCSQYLRALIDNFLIFFVSVIPILVVTYMHRTNYNDLQILKAQKIELERQKLLNPPTPKTIAVNEFGSSGSFNSEEEEETFHPAE